MFRRSLRTLAILGVIAVSCGWTPTLSASPDAAADQAKLQADALKWFEFFAQGDADGMANLYAEDALLMPPGAPAVAGRAGIKTFLAAEAAGTRAAGIALKNAAVTGAGTSGDIGWISGTWVAVDGTGATVDSGNYLSVHRRTNGKWLYIRDTWNSDRPVTPPGPPSQPSGKK
jgi:uncharacterized protein (TIGR02246 family)